MVKSKKFQTPKGLCDWVNKNNIDIVSISDNFRLSGIGLLVGWEGGYIVWFK